MFKVGIMLLEINAVIFIVGTLAFRVTVLGFKVRRLPSIVRILRSVIGPKEYSARVPLLVMETLAGKVATRMFQAGRHVQRPNFEGQGQDTSVVVMIGILAGTFRTLLFGVGTLVPDSVFCGSHPLCVSLKLHCPFPRQQFLEKCKPQKTPKPPFSWWDSVIYASFSFCF